MPTPKRLRVKDKSTGHKFSELAAVVEANPDAYQVLKQDAVDETGAPLPPEFANSESGAPSATTKKENS